MNPQILHEFHLNPEGVHRDYEISLGIANVHKTKFMESPKRDDNSLPIAATYFRRAAADSLLLGNFSKAKSLFHEASLIYKKLKMPYSLALASLATGGRIGKDDLAVDDFYRMINQLEERFFPQLTYLVLAQISHEGSYNTSFERIALIRKNLEAYRTHPVGMLGTSVGSVLEIIDSIVPNFGSRRVDIAEAVTPFLITYNSALRQAAQNRYLWERLALPFHPAEPDIFSILVMTNYALHVQRSTTIQSFIEDAPVSKQSKYFMNNILTGIIGYWDGTHQRIMK